MFTFSFGFFEKACQQQQQPNTYFCFQKEATKSWFENKCEVVFFFLFPHFSKKKGLKVTVQSTGGFASFLAKSLQIFKIVLNNEF